MLQELAKANIVEALPCGVVTLTGTGQVVFANEYLCSMLGYFKTELEGQPVEKIFTISAKIFYQTHFYPLIKLHKKAEEIFFSLKARDNDSIPVIAYATVTGDHIYCVFVPVRQRRKYEEEILQAKKTAEETAFKNDFLVKLKNELELQLADSERQLSQLRQFNAEYVELSRIISHDLHEPVRKLMLTIDMLLGEDHPDEAKLKANLLKMLGSGERLRDLAVCLQEYVSIDTSSEEVSVVDLNAILTQIPGIVSQKYPGVHAEVNIEQLPRVEGYRSQLERLFTEIINNAFRFRRKRSWVGINIRGTLVKHNVYQSIAGKYQYVEFIRLEVEDNGIGFPDEYRSHIFEMFKQLDSRKGGNGFGLALCKKIVQRHQGSLSATVVKGKTVFSILLPLERF